METGCGRVGGGQEETRRRGDEAGVWDPVPELSGVATGCVTKDNSP